MVVFRINPDDAEFLNNKFEPVFSARDLLNIDNLNAYGHLLINGQTTKPFSIQLEMERLSGGQPKLADEIKNESRTKYGQAREDVENQIKTNYAATN